MEYSQDKDKFILGIDFDGTIVTSRFPHIGTIVPGFYQFWGQLKKRDIVTCLWTCRNGRWFEEAKDFLVKNGIEFDYWNHCPDPFIVFGEPGRKIFCDLYVEDKAFGVPKTMFEGKPIVDWFACTPWILEFIDDFDITEHRPNAT